MFNQIRLRQRILLGYLAPLMLLLGAMGLVFISLQEASEAEVEMKTKQEIMDRANDLAYSLARMQRAARGHLLVKNPTSRETYLDNKRSVKNISSKLTDLVTDLKQQEYLREMQVLADEIIVWDDQLIAMIDGDEISQALSRFKAGDVIRASSQLDELLSRFRTRQAEIVKGHQETYENAIHRVANSIIYGMLAATALAVVIGVWLASVISRKITANATQLSSSANEIAATIAQHERTASQQAAAANETSATIEQLSASSRLSAEQAANAAEAAEKAGTATLQGDETTHQAVLAMESLNEKIGAMAEQILHLGEQTGQIGSIATVLKDLAGQINMFALNAAVEAARAGENGKGFAVVAGEIRKLADESKKSAEQTAVLVTDIQQATNTSIMMTEEGTRTVNEVTQLVQTVATLFSNLSNLSGSANESAQQVMLNVKQQSAAFNQAAEATNSIAIGAKETAEGIVQTKVGVTNLNLAADNLKAIA